MIVHLIGPGGAGKSTTAPVLAERLGFDCLDLDQEYLKSSQIDQDVQEKGYAFYVQKNINLYLSLTRDLSQTVIATSSGFMTYHYGLHPAIEAIQRSILESPSTVLLLPSFDLEACVHQIVERQIRKAHESKSVDDQTRRITQRFPVYRSMGNIKVSTNRPTNEVVSQIVAGLGWQVSD